MLRVHRCFNLWHVDDAPGAGNESKSRESGCSPWADPADSVYMREFTVSSNSCCWWWRTELLEETFSSCCSSSPMIRVCLNIKVWSCSLSSCRALSSTWLCFSISCTFFSKKLRRSRGTRFIILLGGLRVRREQEWIDERVVAKVKQKNVQRGRKQLFCCLEWVELKMLTVIKTHKMTEDDMKGIIHIRCFEAKSQ